MGKSQQSVESAVGISYANMGGKIVVRFVEVLQYANMVVASKTARIVADRGAVCIRGWRDFAKIVVVLDYASTKNEYTFAGNAKS